MLLRTENGGVNTPASAFVLILTTVYAFPPVVSKRVVLLSFLSSFFFQPPPSAPAMVRDSSKLLQAAAVTILNPRFVAERYPPCRATPMDATGHETASAGPQSGGRVVSSATQTATNAGGGDVAGFLFDDEEDDDEGSVGHLGTRGGVVVGASPGAASMDSPLVRGMGQGGAGGVTTRDKSQTIANNFLLRLQRQRQEKQRPQNTNAAVACLFGDDGDVWEETVEGEFEENYGDGSKRPTTPTDANPSAQQHPKEPSSHKPGTARPRQAEGEARRRGAVFGGPPHSSGRRGASLFDTEVPNASDDEDEPSVAAATLLGAGRAKGSTTGGGGAWGAANDGRDPSGLDDISRRLARVPMLMLSPTAAEDLFGVVRVTGFDDFVL